MFGEDKAASLLSPQYSRYQPHSLSRADSAFAIAYTDAPYLFTNDAAVCHAPLFLVFYSELKLIFCLFVIMIVILILELS